MNSTITPDYRIYATVSNTDHSLQYRSTVLVNILATPINFLTFYLLLKKSKHEKAFFKYCLFAYHFTFYCCQMQLGVFGGMVTLHPFPAVYCQGLLKNYFDAFTLFMVWCLIFCSFGYSTFFIQITRLQAVARTGKFFDFKKSTYYTIYIVFAIFVYVPVPSLMLLNYSTPEEQAEFVRLKFPNNLKVLEYPGVYIFTSSKSANLTNYIMIFSVLVMFLMLSFLLFGIYWETRVDKKNRSNRNIKDRLKGLQHFMTQSIFMSLFIFISVSLAFKSFFNDPSIDSRISNTIAYTCLCGASIPAQIFMIYRNKNYRNFVLGRKKSVVVIPDISVYVHHRKSIVPNS